MSIGVKTDGCWLLVTKKAALTWDQWNPESEAGGATDKLKTALPPLSARVFVLFLLFMIAVGPCLGLLSTIYPKDSIHQMHSRLTFNCT